MNKLLVILLLAALLFPRETIAEGFNWDHFGTSFALTSVIYGFAHRGMKGNRFDSLVFASGMSLVLSSIYGVIQANQNLTPIDGNKILYNVLGTGFFAGSCLVFKF